MNHTLLRLAPALALCLPLLASAQRAAEPPKPQPLRYDSTYADYKPYRDLEPGDWRGLNTTVGVAGMKHGGMGHSMPSAAAATPTAPAAPASTPKAMPHHHKHHQKGGTK